MSTERERLAAERARLGENVIDPRAEAIAMSIALAAVDALLKASMPYTLEEYRSPEREIFMGLALKRLEQAQDPLRRELRALKMRRARRAKAEAHVARFRR